MGRELQKRKRRSSRPAVRQPSSTRSKLTNPLGNSIIAANWNKKETTMQNYRRLGLVSRLRAPTGGVEPNLHASSSKTKKGQDHFPFNPKSQQGPATSEARVERDPEGRIVRVLSSSPKPAKFNPLDDPLVELDTDSEAGGPEEEEEAEEWDGFEGEGEGREEQNEIVRQLEEEANRPIEKKPRTQSTREVEWLERLVAKHGESNFRAMARDMRLNPMQQTEADIARRIRKWKGE
ncbi:ribosome biogenesis protein Nop16 [Xylariaceae sp. FL0255]|nr:ribosome biogenesis protein Nop16 [Xylariaceae sp. FL0255]